MATRPFTWGSRLPLTLGSISRNTTCARVLRVEAARLTQQVVLGPVEWPWRRFQDGDFFFELLQAGKLHRVLAEVEPRQGTFLPTEIGEHAEHLAGVSSERVDKQTVGNEAIPLRLVLPRRVPQEGIADRRVRDLEIGIDTEIPRRDAIEDHAECVEAPGPPRRRCR